MDHAQGRVTVLDRLHDDADREQIVYLIQRLMLVYHFLIDAEKVLYTSVHMGLNSRIFHVLLDLVHNTLNEGLPDAALL